MLPATATVLPARCTSWPVNAVTVVFPLVPVMAITAGAYCCCAANVARAWLNKSSSLPTSTACARAASSKAVSRAGARPGLTQMRAKSPSASALASSAPCSRRTAGSSWASWAACGGAARSSSTVTVAPAAAHQRAMARPDAPKPITKICCPWSCILLTSASGWTGPAGTRAW